MMTFEGVHERGLSWEEFLEDVVPEARHLVGASVDAYLAQVASRLCRVAPGTVPRPGRFGAYAGFPEDVGFALTGRNDVFLAVQFQIEPGALLPFHPHPGGSVCTLLLEGSARVRNLEFADEEPDWERKGEVLLRQSRDELLLPGRVNLVGNPRDNIHGFRAGPEGARGIDVTTPHFPKERRPDSLLDVAEEPRDPERGLYPAVWRDK